MHDDHDHDLGLAHDLRTLMSRSAERRRLLAWLAAGSAVPLGLLACGGGEASVATAGGASIGSSSSGSTGSCAVIPEETAGPYPADGSNSNAGGVVNVLGLSGIVRSDIRTSIAGATGTAAGVPLTVRLQLVDTSANCADLTGYAIYLWHCTQDGAYSLYSSGVTDENYLRGVQATDAGGLASFTTIFPGCYAGRMPHIHFEVYRSLASATSSTSRLRTSQLALPVAACQQVYATSGYGQSAANLAQISFATDNVFSDGTSLQLATLSGDTSGGYTATLQVGIAA